MMTSASPTFFTFCASSAQSSSQTFGVNAPGAPVGDDAFGVERAEVGARRHVAGPQFQAQSQRFDDAAANLEFQRVVAKQAQVSRSAARGDARRDRDHPSLRGVFGQRIEVGGDRGFERREIALLARGDVAYAVEHDQRRPWRWASKSVQNKEHPGS